jgi:ADP-ribose pyrophosphatase YjhB (NUDIX family)
MEAGESPEAGICREVLEETGLRVKALRLLCCSEFLRMNQVLIAIMCACRAGQRM